MERDTNARLWSADARAGSARFIRQTGERVLRAAELAYYALFLGPRGRGRAAPVDVWDAQYRRGHWQFLASADELPRYAVIAGYIRALGRRPAVLDVGCGAGQLLAVLGVDGLSAYHGIDVSAEAIAQARDGSGAAVAFEQADFTRWRPPRTFDVVVFNEVLYYADHPVRAVARYADALAAEGVMVVSMFRHRNTRIIWRELGRCFAMCDAAEVKNRKGEVVDIKLIRSHQPGLAR